MASAKHLRPNPRINQFDQTPRQAQGLVAENPEIERRILQIQAELHIERSGHNFQEKFSEDAHFLKFPTDPLQLKQGLKEFLARARNLPLPLRQKLLSYGNLIKVIFGFDGASVISSLAGKTGKPQVVSPIFTKEEVAELQDAFTGEIIGIVPRKSRNNHPAFFVVNYKTLHALFVENRDLMNYRLDQPAKTFFEQHLQHHITNPSEYSDIVFGILSGYPRDSVQMYQRFQQITRSLPQFKKLEMAHYSGDLSAEDFIRAIRKSTLEQNDKITLVDMLEARKSGEKLDPEADFRVLHPGDIPFAKKRAYWITQYKNLYSPLIEELKTKE